MARDRIVRRGARAPLALALLFLLVLSATARAVTAPSARERGWLPWLALAHSPADRTPRAAVERIQSGLSTVGALLNGLSADSKTKAFFGKVLEQLESLDLEGLYETLPETDGDWRRVRFTGRRDGEGYRVATVAEAEPCACVPDGPLGGSFGDLAVSFRSRPAKSKESANGNFVGHAHAGLGLGDSRWSSFLEAMVETLKVAELGAPEIAKTQPPQSRPSRETRVKVIGDNPRLGPEDVEVLGIFAESFPELYAHLRELYRVDNVLTWDPLGNTPYRQLRFMISVRREAMKESYPHLLEFLEGLGPLARGKMDVTDAKGRTLFTFRFSTADLSIELGAFVADGRVLPVDGGNVLLAEGVDIRTVTTSSHTIKTSLSFDMNGITTEMRDLNFKVTYARQPKDPKVVNGEGESMALRYVLDEEPVVKVSGSAFGIVPTWAIDILIPGNIEDLTREFMRTVAKGNDGKGLEATFQVQRGARSSVFELNGSAEGLNNALVRIGFKVARRKLIPGEQALDDIGRAMRGAHVAFTRDLARFATTLPEQK